MAVKQHALCVSSSSSNLGVLPAMPPNPHGVRQCWSRVDLSGAQGYYRQTEFRGQEPHPGYLSSMPLLSRAIRPCAPPAGGQMLHSPRPECPIAIPRPCPSRAGAGECTRVNSCGRESLSDATMLPDGITGIRPVLLSCVSLIPVVDAAFLSVVKKTKNSNRCRDRR